ncbi:hypothetical protein FB451DRAFT_1410174 [Mycena latifolia]|nr:hypothetical protein FB451DRAFT_1410174 [Mycena latifolia]
MAPAVITTIYVPTYPSSFTRVFHFPSSTASTVSVASSSPATLPMAALIVVIVLGMLFALLGTCYIVWLCYRRRTRRTRASELPVIGKDVPDGAMIHSPYPRTSVISTDWDDGSSQPFWTKCTVHPPDLNATLLAEVPRVWRILGRPNVATEDSESEFGAAKAEHRKAFS